MRYFLVVCALYGFGFADDTFNSAVDVWLKDWYSSRLLVKAGLDGLMYSWTEGHLWWSKAKTLRCSGGLVDMTDGVRLARFGDAISNLVKNSSRPWVTVSLSLEPAARFAFYGCGIDNSTDGAFSGKLVTPKGGLDLIFTYRSQGWWCTLHTVAVAFSPGRLQIQDLQGDGLSDSIPSNVLGALQEQMIDRILDSTAKKWIALVADGPKCPDKYC